MSISAKLLIFVVGSIILLSFQNCSLQKPNPLNLDANSASSSTNQSSGSGTPPPLTGNSIEAQAITLLQNKCYACHGTVTSGGITQINNPSYLIANNLIIPGNPDGSPIYASVLAGRMPIGSTALSQAELDLLRQWILGGAKAPTDTSTVAPPVVIPLEATYASIQANILTPKCVYCHSATLAKDGIRLDSYTSVKKYIASGVLPTETKLYQVTSSGEMPPRPDVGLTDNELKVLKDWIATGAPNN